MDEKFDSRHGLPMPRFLYGTAWKELATQSLTELAIQQGFRGIDTANQRKHYHEAAVGQAITSLLAAGQVSRSQLFLQTKFTYRRGQDQRLPYDPLASISIQVEQSFASSLLHLGTETIDSYLLHGPSQTVGLATDDWTAWRAMESIHDRGRARWLGISNVSLDQLQTLCREARIPPRIVQNRCYAVRGWDHNVREFCAANQIVYQGFSLLTANRGLLDSPALLAIARRHNRTVEQIVFRFALEVGMIPLTGTTDAEHMRADLEVLEFQLQADEVQLIERLAIDPS